MENALTKSINTLVKKIDPSYRQHLKQVYMSVAQDVLWMMHGGGDPNEAQSTSQPPQATSAQIMNTVSKLNSVVKQNHKPLLGQSDPQTLANGIVTLQATMIRLIDVIQKYQASLPSQPNNQVKPLSDNELDNIRKSFARIDMSIAAVQAQLVEVLRAQGTL